MTPAERKSPEGAKQIFVVNMDWLPPIVHKAIVSPKIKSTYCGAGEWIGPECSEELWLRAAGGRR